MSRQRHPRQKKGGRGTQAAVREQLGRLMFFLSGRIPPRTKPQGGISTTCLKSSVDLRGAAIGSNGFQVCSETAFPLLADGMTGRRSVHTEAGFRFTSFVLPQGRRLLS